MSEVMEQTEGKEVTKVNEEELAMLLAEGKKHQDVENAGDGVKADYILLAKSGTKALKKSQPELYIEGLSVGDFFLQKEKKVLGDKLRVVPLAFITLYQEKESESKDAQFYGIWNKTQAESFEFVEGSYYNRRLPNGHVLIPVNWVCVEVLGHPEIKNGVITYKSTGSRIWRNWKEDVKPRSSVSATLVYEISETEVSNKDNSWTDIAFQYKGNLLEDDKAMAVKCLRKSNAIRDAYGSNTFIPDHVVISQAKMITDASETEETYEDEEIDF